MGAPRYPHIGFLTYAKSFAEAAGDTRRGPDYQPTFSLAGYFLMGRAIELGLKSYLLRSGLREVDLKRIGHNLTEALREALAQRIEPAFVSEDLKDCIAMLDKYYSKKEFEYFSRPMGMQLPNANDLGKAVDVLLRGLDASYRTELRNRAKADAT